MIDFHIYPHNLDWGIKPILFKIGIFLVFSYQFFIILGLTVGFFIYFYLKKEAGYSRDENSIYILAGGLLGGFSGAILTEIILNFKIFIKNWQVFVISGRTITGGILGGMLGVFIVKKIMGIKEKMGNLFAPAIAIGIAIGRLGCFFRGCCYGIRCHCLWAVDFGDGVYRHPTQIYESIFMFAMFLFLWFYRKKAKPGELFYLLGTGYFAFRFLIEFIRVNPKLGFLTEFQWISIIGLIIFQLKYKRKILKKILFD